MKLFIVFTLNLLGVLMIGFGFQYRYQSKQQTDQWKMTEMKTKSVLLIVYGCLYVICILVLFRYPNVVRNQYLPYFLIAFILGKLTYNQLLHYFMKKIVSKSKIC